MIEDIKNILEEISENSKAIRSLTEDINLLRVENENYITEVLEKICDYLDNNLSCKVKFISADRKDLNHE